MFRFLVWLDFVPYPFLRTSGMAEDVIALLDYIGWTEKRDIHVVGISLGGMIAQGRAFFFIFFFHHSSYL